MRFAFLELTESIFLVLFEADNDSEPDWQIRDKILRYLKYYDQSGKLFRVLFVAANSERVRELLRAARSSIPEEMHRMFLFASRQDFGANSPG